MNCASDERAPSSCCLGDLANAYPDSDVSDSSLASRNSSSERVDSLAANDAFDAAVDSQIQLAADAAADDAAALLFVRERLPGRCRCCRPPTVMY